MALTKTISLTDYLVLAGAMACSLFAGMFYSYRERNYNSSYRFHRGAGKLKPIPVALSLIVTFESSIYYLGTPAEIYVHGIQFWLNTVGFAIAYSGVFWISIPMFFPLQVTSVFEYLERRYGSRLIRQLATCLSTLQMVLYSGIVLFGASVAIEPVTNIPKETSIVGMAMIAVLYTSLGGIKAVVVTDVVQTVFMIVGMVAVLIYGIIAVGGIQEVIALNRASGRLDGVDFDINPFTRHTFWTLMIGSSIRFSSYPYKQPVVQRLNSTKSMSDARMVAFISIVGFALLDVFVISEGLVAYAYFSTKGCDPLASGQISNPNQIMPFTVLTMFEDIPGISGLYLAAICSAVLSTVSSQLGSVSAVISEDFIKAHCKTITDQRLTLFSKIIVPVTGIISIGFALLFGGVKGPITQISGSILGAVDGPLASLFIMSIFVKFSTKKGILSGVLVGLAFGIWVSSGYNFSPGRKQTPWLPLGPTDQCIANSSSLSTYENIINTVNDTFEYSRITTPYLTTSQTSINGVQTVADEVYSLSNTTSTTWPMLISTSTGLESDGVSAQKGLHGLDYLYSISYLYIGAMAIIISFLTALIVSKCTQPSKPISVPPELMLSFSRKHCCCAVGSHYQGEDVEICVGKAGEEEELTQPLAEKTQSQNGNNVA